MQGLGVDQLVHVVEDQPDRLGQGRQGVDELGDELRLGAGPPAHGSCSRLERGTDGHAATAATIDAHNRLGSLSSRSRPTHAVSTAVLVRDQSARSRVLPVAGGGADQGDVGGGSGIEVRPQPGPRHELRRELRES